jgi:hypothetical protein
MNLILSAVQSLTHLQDHQEILIRLMKECSTGAIEEKSDEEIIALS